MSNKISLNKVNLRKGTVSKPKKEIKVLSKKTILLGTMSTILVATPMTYCVYHLTNQSINTVWFNGKSFSSKNDVYNYVEKNSIVENYKREDETKSKWVLRLGKLEQVFETPEALREYIYKNQLSVENYVTSLDLSQYIDQSTGILQIDQVIGQLNKEDSNNKVNTSTIYKGKNDSIKTSNDDAYSSYFEPREAYYFNNMYFNSKELLRSYLLSDYLPNNNSSFNSITIVAPNGSTSAPINVNSSNAVSYLTNFINSNVSKVVEYVNPKNDQKINITSENVNSVINDIDVSNFSYQHVQSNQGESRYVIDNSINDNYNLIGPYFYNGNLDIGSFTNKSMWKKVSGMTNNTKHKVAFQESKIDNMIGSFFTMIMNDDNQLNMKESEYENKNVRIFRTLLQDEMGNSLDETYLSDLKDFSQDLYNEVISTNINLMNGKKYNTFYKFPIMYSFILQRLISRNANQKIIDKTIDYFGQVADFLQDILDIIVLDEKMLIGKDGSKLDIKSLFKIGDSTLDLNTTPEYYMNKLKEYPLLIAAISSYIGAANNLNMLSGLMTFSGYDQSYLFEFNVMSKDEFYKEENYSVFKNIYETFSKLNITDIFESFAIHSQLKEVRDVVALSTEEKIKVLSSTSLRTKNVAIYDILVGVTASNATIHELSDAALRAEIDEYIKTGKFDQTGYLYKIKDKASWFIEYTKLNPNADWYKTYLIVLTDHRLNKGVFSTKETLTNQAAYKAAVGKLTSICFASSIGVIDALNDLYWSYQIWSTLHDVDRFWDLMSTLNNAIRRKWHDIKDYFTPNFVWNYLHFHPNAIKLDFVKRWTSFKIMTKFDDYVMPVLNAIGPAFGIAFAAFEIFAIVTEILKVEKFTDYYIYTTADGTEFIWDGGQTTSRYFGLEVKEVNSIDDMKLIEPIQFTLPQVQEFYYYNQVKYYSPEELKRDQLKQMLYGKMDLSNNKYFSYKYTFANVNSYHSSSFNSIEEVLNHVISDLGITNNANGTIDISNINQTSVYFGKKVYSFSNGISTNTAEHSVIANNILNSIRPTLIAKIPTLVDGYADNIDSKEFKLPGLVWNNGAIINNIEEASNYVVDNSANALKDGSTMPSDGNISSDMFVEKDSKLAISKAKESLLATFKSKFNIKTKNILTSSYILNNSFENIPSDINNVSIYKATLPDLGTMYFSDRIRAERWLIKNINFEKYINLVDDKKYIYNNQIFRSKKELEQFVDSYIR